MPNYATINSIGVGICCCHPPIPCIGVSGMVLTGAPKKQIENQPAARVTDIWLGFCGHTSIMVTGSGNASTNNLANCRVGDLFTGCINGIIVSGAPVTFLNEAGSCSNPPIVNVPPPPAPDNAAPTLSPDPPPIAEPLFEGEHQFQASVAPWTGAVNTTDDEYDEQIESVVTENYAKGYINNNIVMDHNPTEINDEESPEPTPQEVIEGCDDIYTMTSFPRDFQLSPNLKLGHVTTDCAVSNYSLKSQQGLSKQDIVCNLRKLCLHIIEPLRTTFGMPTITSGFRHGSTGSSWHKKGSAVDLQWAGMSDAEYYEVAAFIKDSYIWCEVILEYGGARPWIHVAYNETANNRSNFKTRTKVSHTYVYGLLALRNVPYMGGA